MNVAVNFFVLIHDFSIYQTPNTEAIYGASDLYIDPNDFVSKVTQLPVRLKPLFCSSPNVVVFCS